VANAQSILQEIESDVAPCSYALHQAFGLEADLARGNLSTSHRGLATGFLQDDYDACSYTDDSLGDLATLGTAGSGTSAALTQIAAASLNWCVQDAFMAISYLVHLSVHQDVVSDRARLSSDEVALNAQRSRVRFELAALERHLKTSKLQTIKLWRAP
jgi:hypothetical protein